MAVWDDYGWFPKDKLAEMRKLAKTDPKIGAFVKKAAKLGDYFLCLSHVSRVRVNVIFHRSLFHRRDGKDRPAYLTIEVLPRSMTDKARDCLLRKGFSYSQHPKHKRCLFVDIKAVMLDEDPKRALLSRYASLNAWCLNKLRVVHDCLQ